MTGHHSRNRHEMEVPLILGKGLRRGALEWYFLSAVVDVAGRDGRKQLCHPLPLHRNGKAMPLSAVGDHAATSHLQIFRMIEQQFAVKRGSAAVGSGAPGAGREVRTLPSRVADDQSCRIPCIFPNFLKITHLNFF